MAIDASIYGRNPLRSVADYEGDYQRQAMNQQAMQQNALALKTGEMGLQDRQRAVEEAGIVRNALAQLGPNATDDQRITALKNTSTQTGYTAADSLLKAKLEQEKTKAANTKLEVETKGMTDKQQREAIMFNLQQLSSVRTPQQYASWLDGGVKSGLMPKEQAMLEMSQIPADPAQLMELIEQQQAAGVDVKDKLTLKLQAARDAETGRSNIAREKNAAGQLGVAQANLGLSRERLNVEKAAPKGVVYEGADGPVLVDPRAGTAVPITAGGTALGPKAAKLKDIPATVNAKIIEGKGAISNIESAIKAIEAYPDALGWSNMVPGAQAVRQMTDPKGIEARAQVANIGSLVLHDRSGAAVAASEFPRLAPFIPSASDKPDAAIKKLKEMKRIAEDELGLFSDTYNESTGFKPNPLLKEGQKPAAPKAVNFGDLK